MSPKAPRRAWHYFIDADGHLWHEGTEMEDPALLKFFMEKMERLSDGRYHVLCQGEDCYFTAEDVPHVIQSIDIKPDQVTLFFPGAYMEVLHPETLKVGKDNVLYCKIHGGDFTARFNRNSYLELAKQVQFDPDQKSYLFPLGGKTYPIRGVKS